MSLPVFYLAVHMKCELDKKAGLKFLVAARGLPVLKNWTVGRVCCLQTSLLNDFMKSKANCSFDYLFC